MVLARPFFFITIGYFFTLEIILSISRIFFDGSIARKQTPVKVQGRLSPPEGVNYQILWGSQLARAGVEVRLVGHKELRSFREHHLGLPDKDDDADALALAIYGWDYIATPGRFVQSRDRTIV